MLKSFQNQQIKLSGGKTSPVEKILKCSMSSSSLYGTDVIVEEYRQLVDSIARHTVYGKDKIITTVVIHFLIEY